MHSFVQIQSETNPKIEYNIHLENGIPMSCSCKDFLYSSKKDCKHMIEYTRHHTRQFLTSMKMCQQTLLADGSLHQRVSAIEQELFNLKTSCTNIIQRLVALDYDFTQSIGLLRKRMLLQDKYLENHHNLFRISKENIKLKYEIRHLKNLLKNYEA